MLSFSSLESHPRDSIGGGLRVGVAGLKALDLFSGAGGLSCGFAWAGGTVVGGVEIDRYAAETFAANHTDSVVWTEDIRGLTPQEVRKRIGKVDIILGGPMCQGVSQRGPRDPRDARNFAFWAFAEFIRELRPKFFLMENVPALVSDVHNRELAIAVFDELESLGYRVNADVVNAAWLGVPQLRYRLVVAGSREYTPRFPERVGTGIEGLVREEAFTTVGEAIMDLPPVPAGGGTEATRMPPIPSDVSRYVRLLRRRARWLCNHWSADTDEINLARIRYVPEGGNWHDISLRLLPPRFAHVRPSDHTTTYRRLDRRHPAHTITTECGNVTSGAYTHPTQDRAITVREAARLQGFPDTFVFKGPRGSQYRQVGNAVPPLMMKNLVTSLLDSEASGFEGRLCSEVLKRYPRSRLPFTLAPRYKTLFGKSSWVEQRRRDPSSRYRSALG